MSSSPFLMLPSQQQTTGAGDGDGDELRLYSLNQKRFLRPPPLNLPSSLRCVGSSHGWLAFLDETGAPFLINIFSNARITLPPNRSTILKLVLSSDPHAPHHAAVAIYSIGFKTKVAFCRPGSREWTDLNCASDTYYDVVCCNKTNTLFALGAGPLVETWDLTQSVPTKKTKIQDSLIPIAGFEKYRNDLYSSQWYLALHSTQMFLIVRYIGEFVRYDGEVVYEADTLTDYAAEPLVCPYRTVDFRVFRHDGDRKEWVEVGCLGDVAVFLGGNESAVVAAGEHPGLRRNAIYFTDDYWERIDEDYMYGGHDMGVFRVEDGSIEPILDQLEQKIEPPPFWIM